MKVYYKPIDIDENYLFEFNNALESPEFARQVAEVQQKLDYDSKLIEDVLRFHLTEMAKEITKLRPWKKRIMIHGWGYIEIFPLCFNPFSIFYDRKFTEKSLKKFKKELEIINLKNSKK